MKERKCVRCVPMFVNKLKFSMKGLTELDLVMKDLIDIEAEMQAHEKAVDDIHQKVARGEPIVRISRYLRSFIS
jgi:hypothetical protein